MEHALVTGASRGIGQAVASALIRAGTHVTAISRRIPTEDAYKDQNLLHPVTADVGDRKALFEAVQKAVDEFGKLRAVVANAGVCKRAALGDVDSDEVWDSTLLINLTGAYNTIKAVHPHLAPGARIVVVSSALGKEGRETCAAYTASKHGLLGLVRALALELAPEGFRINAVCPGWVDTDMAAADLEETSRRSGNPVEELRELACSQIPMGRFVKASEVASLVTWLLSEQASAITGQAYNISGGQLTS